MYHASYQVKVEDERSTLQQTSCVNIRLILSGFAVAISLPNSV